MEARAVEDDATLAESLLRMGRDSVIQYCRVRLLWRIEKKW